MSASDPTVHTAEDQAALWAARIDGSTLSTAQRAELDAWLGQNTSHRVLLSEYCQFSADLEVQLPALVADGNVVSLYSLPERRRGTGRKWALSVGMAAAAAAAAMLFLVRPAPTLPESQTVATSVGKRQVVTLSDGTQIDLNAQTNLVVETSATERRVRLASGEAFFAVSKDPTRPFTVETPLGSVRVTGTKFDVRADNGVALDILVAEGSVQVRPGELGQIPAPVPVSLTANDHLSATAQGVFVKSLSNSELEDALAWRQGKIVFDNVPLHEALAKFARYHGRGITASPEAAGLKVGGRYSLDDLEGFFSALEEVLPVRVTRDLSGTVRVSLREAAH